MKLRPAHLVVPAALVAAVAIPLASLSSPPLINDHQLVPGQVFPPGPPVTTPQPTVPCVPADACGRDPGGPVNFVWAYIQRYCNGDVIATPPGETTFALVYGNGSLRTDAASFQGTVVVNGNAVPSNPLTTLQPGERDVRLRQGVVPNDFTFSVTLNAFDPAGNPIAFGDGKTTKVLSASGSCPTVDTTTPTTIVVTSEPKTPTATVPPGTFPPAL